MQRFIAFKQVSMTLGWARAEGMQTELLIASQVNVYKLKVKKTNRTQRSDY